MHLRERGERMVADGDKDPRHTIGAALKAVIAIWRIYCWQLMRMTVVTSSSLLITPVIGLLLCIPKYLGGSMTLGEMVQAAAAFVVVQAAFGWFTDNYGRLAEWTSSANRVATLLLALDQVGQPAPPAECGEPTGADQPMTPSVIDTVVAERAMPADAGSEPGGA